MEGNERDDDTESRIDDQRFSGGASGVDEREPSMFSDINAVCKKNIQILSVLQVQRVIRVGITTFGASQNGSYLPRPNHFDRNTSNFEHEYFENGTTYFKHFKPDNLYIKSCYSSNSAPINTLYHTEAFAPGIQRLSRDGVGNGLGNRAHDVRNGGPCTVTSVAGFPRGEPLFDRGKCCFLDSCDGWVLTGRNGEQVGGVESVA